MNLSRFRRRLFQQKGYTLIELLIVLGVLSIITVVAVPGLLRSRMGANEVSAIGGLRQILNSQTNYNVSTIPSQYANTLNELTTGANAGGVGFLDSRFEDNEYHGYSFWLEPTYRGPRVRSYNALAVPVKYKVTGIRSFFMNESGVVHGGDVGGGPANPSLPVVD